jgi:putative ABC transport system substrate-binding protein
MTVTIGRRELLAALGGAAAAWPLAARAQQSAMPVIGFLHSEAPGRYTSPILRAFRQGLSESGHVEGRNVAIEYRWAESRYDRLPDLAGDLVGRGVNVIIANGGDPIKLGLVASPAQPGGNLTGVTNLRTELGPKRLELLHELVPAAASFAVLVNPTYPDAAAQSEAAQAAARARSLRLDVFHASTERDFDSLFPALAERRVGGLVIVTDPFFNNRAAQLAALALRHAMPTVYHMLEFVTAGGLAGYGNSNTDLWRQIGIYTGRILKGEKPADLPVMQPTKFELLINLNTAKALGLTVPDKLLVAADEVIE